jgi:hypothetical protein
MSRKLFAQDIEEEDLIDFDAQVNPSDEGGELNEQLAKNLDSVDEKLRDLSCVSIANLSSSMPAEFYSRFLAGDIVQKLTSRVTDPYSQVSYNSLSALQRLVALCPVHNQTEVLEKSFKEALLIQTVKTQVDSLVGRVRASIAEKLEKKQTSFRSSFFTR